MIILIAEISSGACLLSIGNDDSDYITPFPTVKSGGVWGKYLRCFPPSSYFALPYLLKSKGCIVNNASVSGLGADWEGLHYSPVI